MEKNIQDLLESLSYSQFEEEENPGYDEAHIIEVADNGIFKLYEIDNGEIFDCSYVTEECIPVLFPDFVIEEDKVYLIGDENGLYFEN